MLAYSENACATKCLIRKSAVFVRWAACIRLAWAPRFVRGKVTFQMSFRAPPLAVILIRSSISPRRKAALVHADFQRVSANTMSRCFPGTLQPARHDDLLPNPIPGLKRTFPTTSARKWISRQHGRIPRSSRSPAPRTHQNLMEKSRAFLLPELNAAPENTFFFKRPCPRCCRTTVFKPAQAGLRHSVGTGVRHETQGKDREALFGFRDGIRLIRLFSKIWKQHQSGTMTVAHLWSF